jgi:hypothetical protein
MTLPPRNAKEEEISPTLRPAFPNKLRRRLFKSDQCFQESFPARSAAFCLLMTGNERTNQTRAAAEMLEDRIAPATLPLLDLSGGTVTGTFTDADGDTVTVRIEGSAGKVEFQDTGGNSVDDGENIASVIITGANANFALTYSFDAAGGGVREVTMGNITSNKVIRGVFSVPLDATTGTFTLGSFVGPGFSAGGGLSADNVAGNADGMGIQLNSLGAGRSINIRNIFTGDLLILGSLGGSIVVSDVDAASAWQINKTVTPTAQIGVGGGFHGTFEARGVFAGNVHIGGAADGPWTFNKNVLKSAQLLADDWDNIQALKNWGGQLFSPFGGVTIAVSGQILGTSVFSSESAMELTVDGSVQAGATFGCSSDITATVGGNLAGDWTSSADVSLTVSGNVSGAVINSGSEVRLTVDKSILKSKLLAKSDLAIDVTGNVNSTELTAQINLIADISGSLANSKASAGGDLNVTVGGDISGSDVAGHLDAIVDVSGRVVGSQILAEHPTNVDDTMLVEVDLDFVASVISGIGRNATLSVGRNLIASTVNSGNIAQITVSGSLMNTKVAAGNDASVAVTGNVKDSTITAATSDVSLSVGGNFLASSVSCDEIIVASIAGNMSGLLNSFTSDITLTVGGTMSGKAIAGEDVIADLGQLTGSLSSDQLDLIVQGNVAASARIQAEQVDDLNSDTVGFHIGDNFAGVLNVNSFDSDVAGGSTLVEGDVLKSARFNIGRRFGASADESFTFGGDFLGVLNIGGDIDVNLAFAGDVNQVIIGGLVGTTGLVNTIAIGGKLKFLSSGSLFDETTPGKAGSFENGAGIETATLSVDGGFITVTPVV